MNHVRPVAMRDEDWKALSLRSVMGTSVDVVSHGFRPGSLKVEANFDL